jgi:hypothetical protein
VTLVPDLYFGTWELIPELSLYESGPLPTSCTYTVEERGEAVHVTMTWRFEADGPESRTEFGGPSDGTRHVLDGGVTFSVTRIGERTLDSHAFRGDDIVAYARRTVSADGALMAIVQEGERPGGGRFRNFQVYRRLS